jgi:SAM-dependent methyltransferase
LSFADLQPFWSGLFKENIFFTYDRCNRCALLFAPTFFDEAQLSRLYADMAPNMDVVPPEPLQATQVGYFDAAASFGPLEGGYLEIGPDVGYVAGEAARRGRFEHFWLFEPNRGVHDRLRRALGGKPHSLSADMNNLDEVPNNSVGLAVLVQVLDHLLDPLSTLRQIRAKLKPGGTLMIVTHNEASLLRRILGVRWPVFCLQHPQIYSPQSMKLILESADFSTVKIRRSKNYFPLAFLIRQAAFAMRVDLGRLRLPGTVGLRLGNILTLASP